MLSGLNDVDYASMETDMNFISTLAFKLFLGLTRSFDYAVFSLPVNFPKLLFRHFQNGFMNFLMCMCLEFHST